MEIQGTIYQGKERALGGQPLEKDFFVEKSGGWNQYEEHIGEDADILWAETAAKGDISEIAGETDLSVEDREKLISKIKKLLTEFGMWEPHIRGEGTEEFESLKKLYMLILKQIVQLPQYEEQKALFSLLDRYMLKGAERYSEKYFGTLVRFFKQFGNSREDYKKGYMILRKNWKVFSEGLPVSVKEKRELDASFESPWGMYISPLNSLYYSKEKHPLILSTIVLVSIIVLWYLSIYTF